MQVVSIVIFFPPREHKNKQLEKECVTPIEAHSLVKIIELHVLKLEHPVTCLATMGYVYAACTIHVTIFSTGGNSRSYSSLPFIYTLISTDSQQMFALLASIGNLHLRPGLIPRPHAYMGMMLILGYNTSIASLHFDAKVTERERAVK